MFSRSAGGEGAKGAGGSSFEVYRFFEEVEVSPLLGSFGLSGCCKKLCSSMCCVNLFGMDPWRIVTSMKQDSPE
jgi:hypothetical protein